MKKSVHCPFRSCKKTEASSISGFFEFNLTPCTCFGTELQLVDTSTLFFKRAVHWWAIFFRRAGGGEDQFKRSKKIRVHPSGTGPVLCSSSFARLAPLIAAASLMTSSRRREEESLAVQIGNRRPDSLPIPARSLVQRAKR